MVNIAFTQSMLEFAILWPNWIVKRILCPHSCQERMYPCSHFLPWHTVCCVGEAELKKRSHSVQRNLPRPIDCNSAVLRPTGPNDPPLTDLQKAEELIKKEMLTMLHHDAVYSPTLAQQGMLPSARGKKQAQKAAQSQTQHVAYLEQHPYVEFQESEIDEVSMLCVVLVILTDWAWKWRVLKVEMCKPVDLKMNKNTQIGKWTFRLH